MSKLNFEIVRATTDGEPHVVVIFVSLEAVTFKFDTVQHAREFAEGVGRGYESDEPFNVLLADGQIVEMTPSEMEA